MLWVVVSGGRPLPGVVWSGFWSVVSGLGSREGSSGFWRVVSGIYKLIRALERVVSGFWRVISGHCTGEWYQAYGG